MNKKIYLLTLLLIAFAPGISMAYDGYQKTMDVNKNYIEIAKGGQLPHVDTITSQTNLKLSNQPTMSTLSIPTAPPPGSLKPSIPVPIISSLAIQGLAKEEEKSKVAEIIAENKDEIERGERAKLVNQLMDLDYNTKSPPKQLYNRKNIQENQHLPPVYFKSYYLSLAFKAAENDNVNDLQAALSRYDFLNGQNKDGDTILMYAVQYHSMNVARVVLAKGAYVNGVNNRKRTALHYAATLGDLDLIKLLLTMGADSFIQDDLGKTASDYAEASNHQDAFVLIKTYEK